MLGLPGVALTEPEPVGNEVPQDVFQLPTGTACHQGAHLDATQNLVPSLSPGANGPMEERFALRQQFFPRAAKISGTLASLVLDGDVNYFHWLVETLPRWRFLEDRKESLSGIYVCQKHLFHREAMRLLGVKPEMIRDSSAIPYLRADEILVPRYVQRMEPWILPWVRDHFSVRPDTLAIESKKRRIYISRRAASSRGIANEAELLLVLEEFGFGTVVLEELPWPEQIALFQRAQAVIGAHGAGLTNLVFCGGSAFVLELTPIGLLGPFYEEIGTALQLDYHTLRCVSAGTGDLHAQPMTVDVGKVRDVLKSRLGQ